METLERRIVSKNEITDKALSYDNGKLDRSIVFMKGARYALKLAIPFIQDSFRQKFKQLIE